jgi:hypothetical protein
MQKDMTTESQTQSQIQRSKTLATARRRSANNRTDNNMNEQQWEK